MKTLLTITLALVSTTALPCNNNCWLSIPENQAAITRIINAHKAKKLQPLLDAICEQGRPITKQQRRLARRLHLKKCGHTPIATVTPTVTPHASPTPTPTATATATTTPHVTPTPSASPTPRPTPTCTPHPTPTPSVSPTASPTCTPSGHCVRSTVEWKDNPDQWPPEALPLQIGNHFYDQDQCLDILNGVEDGIDGLTPLAKEMIAARLNIANGAGHDCVDGLIMQAQLVIGDLIPRPIGNDTIPLGNVRDTLIFPMARYNKGESCCSSHCEQ